MRGRRYLALAAIATALTVGTSGFAGEPRAVIELFTSQGCSSCPPADRLLAQLAQDPSLIPLSLPIDYWDYLGWKDTLALAGHANRQRAYSRVRGDRDVYTPQAVINGSVQALGSDRAAIDKAIAQSRNNSQTLSLPLTLTIANGQLTVSAPAARSEVAQGEVWLCPLTRSIEVAIGRGENTGHTFTYHNVVRRWIKLGDWNGQPATWSIPVTKFKVNGVDAAAVVLQNGVASAPGVMLGAAMMPLDSKQAAVQPAKP
ncbi:MAG TPA: DUF1223 domain-containing protein [Xanthobacteraceae bacterium]|jgi:hypothetical protein|nr:DUF1223 domain-containing protein [Xanthobacteraceae bacterium]